MNYEHLRDGIVELLDAARRGTVRTVNAIMTAASWETGRRISEFELRGRLRADYGAQVLERLGRDLTARFGRGFSRPNLTRARLFYLAYPPELIRSTASHESILMPQGDQRAVAPRPTGIRQTVSAVFNLAELAAAFPLAWSHYVLLLKARPGEELTPTEAVKDPLILEFLNLKDEYSETDLEDALIDHLQQFLLETPPNPPRLGIAQARPCIQKWRKTMNPEPGIATDLETLFKEVEAVK